MTFFVNLYKKCPKWCRYVVIVIVAVAMLLLGIFGTSACSTVRVTQNSNGEVKVTSSNSVMDSTKIEINVLNSKKNGN